MTRTGTGSFGYQSWGGTSRRDRVARIDALATLLDTAFILPGTNIRFGLDALIGLVPGFGDVLTTAMSLYIVHEAHQLGAPSHVLARMVANVALDGFVGAVPLVGDAFDVAFRANRRNMALLRDWMERKGSPENLMRVSAPRRAARWRGGCPGRAASRRRPPGPSARS